MCQTLGLQTEIKEYMEINIYGGRILVASVFCIKMSLVNYFEMSKTSKKQESTQSQPNREPHYTKSQYNHSYLVIAGILECHLKPCSLMVMHWSRPISVVWKTDVILKRYNFRHTLQLETYYRKWSDRELTLHQWNDRE